MKVYLIKGSEQHHWKSCQMIIQEVWNEAKDIPFVQRVAIDSPDDVLDLQIDTKDTYYYFLGEESDLCDFIQNVPESGIVVLPIYGNLTIELEKWKTLDTILKNKKVLLLSASFCQTEQIKRLINKPNIIQIPYPVKEMKKKSNPKRLPSYIYAGRITPQKNILQMMKAFIKALALKPNLRLTLAGAFHERGFHLHGIYVDFKKFKEDFHKLINFSNGAITYLGDLSQDQLHNEFRKNSFVISMSTYHDEDFGLSVAQGINLGLSPLLSAWGGHLDFIADKKSLVKVHVKNNLPIIDSNDLIKKLFKSSESTINDEQIISGKAYWHKLEKELSTPNKFEGISSLYKKYIEESTNYYVLHHNHSTDFYSQLYSGYTIDL